MSQKIDIINNWTLPRIFQELENGNMRIPRFQRAYVWHLQGDGFWYLLHKPPVADGSIPSKR